MGIFSLSDRDAPFLVSTEKCQKLYVIRKRCKRRDCLPQSQKNRHKLLFSHPPHLFPIALWGCRRGRIERKAFLENQRGYPKSGRIVRDIKYLKTLLWLQILMDSGAGSRIRTDDRLITNQVLYQLSYTGDSWERVPCRGVFGKQDGVTSPKGPAGPRSAACGRWHPWA